MFQSIKDLFSANVVNNEPGKKQLEIAAATLMFELIRSDGNIDDSEIASFEQI